MLSLSSHFGNGKYMALAGTTVLSIGMLLAYRSLNVNPSSGAILKLPTLATVPVGGPLLYINNSGSFTLTVQRSDGTTLGTIISGNVGVLLSSASDFTLRSYTRNTVRTAHVQTRSDIISIADPSVAAVAINCAGFTTAQRSWKQARTYTYSGITGAYTPGALIANVWWDVTGWETQTTQVSFSRILNPSGSISENMFLLGSDPVVHVLPAGAITWDFQTAEAPAVPASMRVNAASLSAILAANGGVTATTTFDLLVPVALTVNDINGSLGVIYRNDLAAMVSAGGGTWKYPNTGTGIVSEIDLSNAGPGAYNQAIAMSTKLYNMATMTSSILWSYSVSGPPGSESPIGIFDGTIPTGAILTVRIEEGRSSP